MSTFPWLSFVIFAPWLAGLVLALLPRLSSTGVKTIGLLGSFSTLLLAVPILGSFDAQQSALQFIERHAWIESLRVDYHLGLDGMSLLLTLLTGVLGPAALLAARPAGGSERLFHILFLLLQGAALGVFLALNFFHWFLFWELSLVPAFFLIRLWGGSAAGSAAYQFVIYTVAGSVFMLLAFAAIFAAAGTLDFVDLRELALQGSLRGKLAATGTWLPQAAFLGVFLGLAVKVPLFPFHGWLPGAYAEAPVGASMFLTGILSKMGVYGFLRILWPLFPAELQAGSTVILGLALAGVVVGALAALRQSDLKRMIAYSSINHVNYCLLALLAVSAARGTGHAQGDAGVSALAGALLQMFNHGLSAAALFFGVGILERRAGGLRGLSDFGGVRGGAPVFAGLLGIALFSSLGLPGLNGFVGEFLIFRGVFALAPWAAVVGCIGLFATALFLLTFWQRVFHGPAAGAAHAGFEDIRGGDRLVLGALAALMLLFGILPHLLTGLVNPLVTSWLTLATLP